ncbi:hypothetical protein [Capnocytophaga leadbetteri]|nr:hypothetical protein [Capnocytophaga leadbetteri]
MVSELVNSCSLILRSSFAYRSLILRSSFAHRSVKVRGVKRIKI